MSFLLKLVSPTGLLLIALAVMGALLGLSRVQLANERAAHATTRAAFADERTKASDAARAQSEAHRAKENADRQKLNEVQTNGQIVVNAIALDAAGTERANSSLRDALDIAARAIRSSATGTPTTAPSCDAAIEAVRLRSDLLAGLAGRGAAVAEFADRTYLAAESCVRAYELSR